VLAGQPTRVLGSAVLTFLLLKKCYQGIRDGNFTHGYGYRMGRVWAYFYTHEYYSYPTHLVMGRARV
jgi:hypothetical protein